MAATEYTYALTDFANGLADIDSLTIEIQASAIVIALDYINVGTDCRIWFKAVLSAGDKAVLDGIVAAHTGDPPDDPTTEEGFPIVTQAGTGVLGGRKGRLHMDQWSPTSGIGSASWKSCYNNVTGGVLYECVWQINSNQMEVQVKIDGLIVLQAEIDEMRKDFRFTSGEGGSGSEVIVEYRSKRWRFKPPEAVEFSQFEVLFRKTGGGNKKIDRGMTIWREAPA